MCPRESVGYFSRIKIGCAGLPSGATNGLAASDPASQLDASAKVDLSPASTQMRTEASSRSAEPRRRGWCGCFSGSRRQRRTREALRLAAEMAQAQSARDARDSALQRLLGAIREHGRVYTPGEVLITFGELQELDELRGGDAGALCRTERSRRPWTSTRVTATRSSMRASRAQPRSRRSCAVTTARSDPSMQTCLSRR